MALAVLGALVGLDELYALAFSALVALAAAAVWARRQRLTLAAQLLVAPGRASQGTHVQASVGLLNLGARATPPLSLEVPVARQACAGSRSPTDAVLAADAVLTAPPLAPGEQASARLRMPTEERGLWSVGPVGARLTDPLGLFERRWSAAAAAGFAVHPRIVRLRPLPRARDGAQAGASPRPGTAPTDELDGWRDYQPGDDMRRVHWKLTAKRDRLSVRQDVASKTPPAMVLVDLGEGHHYPGTLDACAEAAASVVTALLRAPLASVVLATTAGRVEGPSPAPVPPGILYDVLAAAELHEGATALVPGTPGWAPHGPGTARPVLPAPAAELLMVVAPTAEAGAELASTFPVDNCSVVVIAACQKPPGATPLGAVTIARTGTAVAVLWAGADLPAAWAALAASRPWPLARVGLRAGGGGKVFGGDSACKGTTPPVAPPSGVTAERSRPLPYRRDWS
jgi:hypothetical protein